MDDVILAIRSPSDYDDQFNLLYEIVSEKTEKASQNATSVNLLQTLYEILSDDGMPPYTRFACLLIAKDIFHKKFMPFMSALSTSKFFQKMIEFARTVDPRKPVDQKGKKLFKDKELGNSFIRLILESILKWSQRFPMTSSQVPTRLKKAYNELMKDEVVFPTVMQYYSNQKREERTDKDKSRQREREKERDPQRDQQFAKNRSSIPQKKEKQEFKTPTGDQPGSPNNRNAGESIKQSLHKIQGFLNFIEECESEDQLYSEIERYHKLFQQESVNNGAMIEKVLEQKTLSQQLVGVMMLINQFYSSQNKSFVQFLGNGRNLDLKSYIDQVLMDSAPLQTYFKDKENEKKVMKETKVAGSTAPTPPPYSGGNQDYASSAKVEQKPKVVKKEISRIKSNQDDREDDRGRQRDRERENQRDRQRQRERQRDRVSKITTATSNLKDLINDQQLEDATREGEYNIKDLLENYHPASSFGTIRRQLQQELGDRVSKSRSRSRKPKSQSKRVRGDPPSHSPSTFKSKVSIFDLKLNSVVKDDNYSGTIVNYSNQYQVGSVNQYQGNKRLKRSNLIDKGILLENELLQIGYKTEPCYEDVNGYKVSLRMILYYGNKSESLMTRFQVEFEGDDNSLVYRNPQVLPDQIEPGHQIKQELYIVPISIPFGLLSINIQYSIGRQFPDFTVYLPNSLLKYLVTHQITPLKFEEVYSRHLDNQFRSVTFPLSREFEIQTLEKLFPHICFLTKLDDFVSQRQYTELTLGLFGLLVDCDQYLIKIYVRPNLTAAIQLVHINDSGEEDTYTRLLVQSLQFVLQSS